VMADLEASNGDLSGVIGFYKEDLSQMRKEAPDLFDALEQESGEDFASSL